MTLTIPTPQFASFLEALLGPDYIERLRLAAVAKSDGSAA